jgi:hypothetical protein
MLESSGLRLLLWDRPPGRSLEFLHFGTDFLTVPPRIDQAEAHVLYQGMASAVPLEAEASGTGLLAGRWSFHISARIS